MLLYTHTLHTCTHAQYTHALTHTHTCTHTHTHKHSYPAAPRGADFREWEDEEGEEEEEKAKPPGVGSTDSSSEEEEGVMVDHSLDSQLPLLVLPLYSLLSAELQAKVRVSCPSFHSCRARFSCHIKPYT